MGVSIDLERGYKADFINAFTEKYEQIKGKENLFEKIMDKFVIWTTDREEFFILHNEYYDSQPDWDMYNTIDKVFRINDSHSFSLSKNLLKEEHSKCNDVTEAIAELLAESSMQ